MSKDARAGRRECRKVCEAARAVGYQPGSPASVCLGFVSCSVFLKHISGGKAHQPQPNWLSPRHPVMDAAIRAVRLVRCQSSPDDAHLGMDHFYPISSRLTVLSAYSDQGTRRYSALTLAATTLI
jgi:hypothetical protein